MRPKSAIRAVLCSPSAVVICAAPLLSGCAAAALGASGLSSLQSTLQAGLGAVGLSGSSAPSPPQAYSNVSTRNGEIEAEIVRTVIPGEPDYVATAGNWVEYVVRLKNLTKNPVLPKAVKLIDERGAYLSAAGSMNQLVEMPSATGMVAAQQALMGGSMLLPSLAPSLFMVPGAGALAAQALSAAPGAIAEMQTKQFRDAHEAFSRRRISTVVDPKGEATGSVWLPMTSNPQAFLVEYDIGPQSRSLRIPLRQTADGRG